MRRWADRETASDATPSAPPNAVTRSIGATPKISRQIVLVSICMGLALAPADATSTRTEAERKDTDAVVQALCGKSVALLGEPPVHGFGKTEEFKVELVRRLVDDCHFNALFVESGIYDYVNIEKKLKLGQDVTDSMIAAAIGGIWATAEVKPLIPFLRHKLEAGGFTLAGLDDQLGRGTYAQREMPSDLVQQLQGDERSQCLATLQKYTLWQYSDDAPYGPAENARIVGCLDRIEARLSPGERKASRADEDRAMIDSLKRFFARNLTEEFTKAGDPDAGWNERDRSMYLNFRWLLSRLPRHSKIIVWAATVHVAKAMSPRRDSNARSRWARTSGATSTTGRSLLASRHIQAAMRSPVSPFDS